MGSSSIRLPLLFYLDSVSLEMVLRTIRSVEHQEEIAWT